MWWENRSKSMGRKKQRWLLSILLGRLCLQTRIPWRKLYKKQTWKKSNTTAISSWTAIKRVFITISLKLCKLLRLLIDYHKSSTTTVLRLKVLRWTHDSAWNWSLRTSTCIKAGMETCRYPRTCTLTRAWTYILLPLWAPQLCFMEGALLLMIIRSKCLLALGCSLWIPK